MPDESDVRTTFSAVVHEVVSMSDETAQKLLDLLKMPIETFPVPREALEAIATLLNTESMLIRKMYEHVTQVDDTVVQLIEQYGKKD